MSEPEFVTVARRVAERHQFEEYDGVLLDAFTARVVARVWDALSEAQREALVAKGVGLAAFSRMALKVVRVGG